MALRFSLVVQRVVAEARRLGLDPPGFRAPPRRPGCDRTIRRLAVGGAVIAVRLHGRPFDDVVADGVVGVVVAAGLGGGGDRADPTEADRVRRALSLAATGPARAA